VPLHAEQGRLYRDKGAHLAEAESDARGRVYLGQAVEILRKALQKTRTGLAAAELLDDVAQSLLALGDLEGTRQAVAEMEGVVYAWLATLPGQDPADARFLPLGRAAWLCGRVAFRRGPEHWPEAARYYLQAYANLWRFSPHAVQIGYLIDDYVELASDRGARRRLLSLLEQGPQVLDGVDLVPFVDSVRLVI
jgi:hypothetical protein